jgi:hypothetical protein
MMLVVAAAGYVLYALWPVFQLRANVKSELADALPFLWRWNLRGEVVARIELPKLRQELLTKLTKIGVRDKKLDVRFERSKEKVAIQALFTAPAVFPWLDKRVDIACAPRVETDAGRVDW